MFIFRTHFKIVNIPLGLCRLITAAGFMIDPRPHQQNLPGVHGTNRIAYIDIDAPVYKNLRFKPQMRVLSRVYVDFRPA